MLQLLTAKPVLYVCNVEEASADKGNSFSAKVFERAKEEGAVPSSSPPRSRARSPCCRCRSEGLPRGLGLEEPGLNRVIRAGYELLGLITYFTVGPKEARAWTITKRHQGAAGGGRDPHRFREGLHPRRDHRLRRLRRVGARPARAMPARCGWKARNTSSRTAT
jgi:ribosome-binding ATPase YchF (GTP1/OBG family)